jgi:16S rRNA (uracil1498-N3)-methyltransferase
MMHRFFLDAERIQAGTVRFNSEISHQIKRVLRLAPGDQVMVLDGQGNAYTANLDDFSQEEITGTIINSQRVEGEPTCQVTLFAALTQREKFEWILQKCTELGVAGFTPVITERTIVRNSSSANRKAERWKKIIREAAEQSRRSLIPKLVDPLRFSEAVIMACNQNDVVLFLWEGEQERSMRNVFTDLESSEEATSIGLFVGPEGGYSENEVKVAVKAGCIPVTLGRRILRMETAAVTAAALVLYEAGDLA